MVSLVPIDRSSWSPSSQRSSGGHYDQSAINYESVALRCRACSVGFTFTPEQQRIAYEVKKKFVWWQPSLCAACEERLEALKALDRELQARWNASRESLANDRRFLEEWLAVAEGMSRHGKPNGSLERMLLKRMRTLAIDQNANAT
jgi:hypothetical protein